MEKFPHQREFTRVRTSHTIEVRFEGHSPIICESRNMSMKGLYAAAGHSPAPVDTHCEITVFLGGQETGVRAEARGRVAFIDEGGFAVEFLEIVGMESFEHLRNLVLYNAPEPDPIEEELQSHLGIRRK